MLSFFLNDSNWPFQAAIAIVLAIFALTLVLSMVGLAHFGDHDLDHDFDFHADHSGFESAMLWLGFGRIPFLALLSLIIGTFGIFGFALNLGAFIVTGHLFPSILSVPLAVVLMLPAVAQMSRVIARLIPRDETNVIRVEDLVGGEATITHGTATYMIAAPALAYDKHGVMHTFSVRTNEPGLSIPERTKVRLQEYVKRDGSFVVAPINQN